jgi:hypothetical protein
MILFLAACTSKTEEDPLHRFEKLSGLWQTHNSEADIYEEWTKASDSVMYGKSYVLNETDTIINERIELKKIGNEFFYIPTVTGQNNNQPVQFKLINNTDSLLVFDNPDHDFPQRIMYRFYGKDSIVARVQGIVKGELQFEEFYFRRVPHSQPKH